MNDSIAFLALMTTFGLACLAIGFGIGELMQEREVQREIARFSRDYPDEIDSAGA